MSSSESEHDEKEANQREGCVTAEDLERFSREMIEEFDKWWREEGSAGLMTIAFPTSSKIASAYP